MENKISGFSKPLLFCGVLGSALFVAAFFIQGAFRPGYDWLRNPVSSLSIGEAGWIQVANFISTGSLFVLCAIGLRLALRNVKASLWGPILLSLVGIGLIGAGIFTTDPVYGYPSSSPLLLAQTSFSGNMHDRFSILVFVCLPIACFVLRRRFSEQGEKGWAAYSMWTAIGMLTLFILAGAGFKQVPVLLQFAGVFQRLSIIIGWMWIALMALHFIRFEPFQTKKTEG